MAARIARGNRRPYKGQAPTHTIQRELTITVGANQMVKERIRNRGLTYTLKSARLLTGTQIVKATYRIEDSNATRK